MPGPLWTSARFILAAGVLTFAGCNSSTSAPAATPAEKPAAAPSSASAALTDAHRAEAKEIFASRCTPCHGQTGGGDGPASAGLTPKPANFHSPEWQKSVTDEHIEKIIKYGGGAVGKAPMMPANPDLADKEAVVAAIREYVRTLGTK